MAKSFRELEKKMSIAAQKRANKKAKELLQAHVKELNQEEPPKRLYVEQTQSILRKYIEIS